MAACALALAAAPSCGPSSHAPTAPAVPTAGESTAGDTGGDTSAAATPQKPIEEMTLAQAGLDPDAIDPKADPCDDFFQYACGGWLAKTEIPADRATYGRFTEIADRNEATLHDILDKAAAAAKAGKSADPVSQKIGTYYGACMDEKRVEKAGLKPIAGLLKTVHKVRNLRSLNHALTELAGSEIPVPFNIGAEADFKDATHEILWMEQAGLGLPDRDYYLSDKPKMESVRKSYREHLVRVFTLVGQSKARAGHAADDVIRIETALAKASKPRQELNDPKGVYNKVDRAGLAKMAPNLDWDAYFKGLGHPAIDEISVNAPAFMTEVSSLMKAEKPSAWQSYLTYHVVSSATPALPKRFVDAQFDLAKILTGATEQRPRWKRCVAATDDAMGEYLAQPFVAERFSGSSKDSANQMLSQIGDAFTAEVKKLDWMSPDTKQKALAKLTAMTHHIGYPDKWRTYDFEVGPVYGDDFLAARRFDQNYDLDKVGKPVDRGQWGMTPPTVNAYYNPVANQMVFPAGILQPPFFDAKAQVAVNLGAMGMVMGHELTHAFDDEGSQFDGDGNMKNWWQDADAKEFKDRGQCVVDQYAAYQPLPGTHINGKLTEGENIADLGGIKLAFHAYRAMRASAPKAVVAGGYSEDQLFFLATGQAWCTKVRDQERQRRVLIDPHSPPHFRVNGVLSDLPEFHEAFHCAAGKKMHPAKTCQVW